MLAPLGDGKNFVVARDFIARLDGLTIVVKRGFITDLTSIPRIFWWILDRWGKYGFAAVVHDFLYWMQFTEIPKARADLIFYRLMIMSGTPKLTARVIYLAVKYFGGIAWRNNAKQKKSDGFCEMNGDIIRWPQWAKQIREPNIKYG